MPSTFPLASVEHGKAQRKAHAFRMRGGEWTAETYAPVYREAGLNSQHFLSVMTDLNGKVDAAREAAKLHVEALEGKIESKKIEAKRKRLLRCMSETAALNVRLVGLYGRSAWTKDLLDTAKPEHKARRVNAHKLVLEKADKLRRKIREAEKDFRDLPFAIHQGGAPDREPRGTLGQGKGEGHNPLAVLRSPQTVQGTARVEGQRPQELQGMEEGLAGQA